MELKEGEESPAQPQLHEKVEVVAATRPIPIKGRRRNLGRQARKRRKKYLEIEAAASAFVSAATSAANFEKSGSAVTRTTRETTQTKIDEESPNHLTIAGANGKPKVLPTDRGYILDDVRIQTVLSEADQRELIRQLGYLPGNALKVVACMEDAFSCDDLQRLFAAAAAATVETNFQQTATKISTDSSAKNCEADSNSVTTSTSCGESRQANEQTNEKMAAMIQNMMKEPLVIKLYPLALRDESSSTKRRRKRRREEIEEESEDKKKNTDVAVKTADQPKTTPLMEPFPTIYWVTHPLIKALISKLELDRLNVQFEQRLEEEAESKEYTPTEKKETIGEMSVLESMKRAHISYGKERRELLSEKDKDYVIGRGWYGDEGTTVSTLSASKNNSIPPFSEQCGVAGIRNPKAVKCLHAHAAHYWSGNSDNVVGKWVSELLMSGGSFFQGSIEDTTDTKLMRCYAKVSSEPKVKTT